MWTSNSGDPFNQPSKSCTKWLLVMYKPGGGGGGGGGDPPPPLPPPSPQSIRHCSRAGRAGWAGTEKSVSTGTMAVSEEHTSEVQPHHELVCRLMLEKNSEREKPH